MSSNEQVIELAQRGQDAPETLTEDEIRELCLAVLADEQGGDFLRGRVSNEN